MKEYFLKLFGYDRATNQTIAAAIIEANEPPAAVQLMAHLLAAQQTWLKRCKNLPAPGGPLWPDWPASTFEKIIDDNYTEWTEFISRLRDDDMKMIVSYRNTAGTSYESTPEDILAHLINHGTHHRAQIGQHLKLSGVEKLPVTDYIFYTRQ
jgi:uncharacterized damage-inducible protein DinB